jgi:hypothetical protein
MGSRRPLDPQVAATGLAARLDAATGVLAALAKLTTVIPPVVAPAVAWAMAVSIVVVLMLLTQVCTILLGIVFPGLWLSTSQTKKPKQETNDKSFHF